VANYEYRCEDDHPTELRLSMNAEHPTEIRCRCGKPAKRQFSAPLVTVCRSFWENMNYYDSLEGKREYGKAT